MHSLMGKHALRVFRAALRAADPEEAVLRHVQLRGETLIAGRKRYPLGSFADIYVVGAGKAGAPMARALERILGRRITGGFVNVKYGHGARLRRVEIHECGHPVPDAAGEHGAARIAEIAHEAGPDDLILAVISGGASALLPQPAPPVTLREKQAVTRLLLDCGAGIHEINCVRKHLSRIKGGQLARFAYPSTVLTLILSDVIGDDMDVIGSGPAVPDPSTFADARAIFNKYGIWRKIPARVRERLDGSAPETPKPGDRIFTRVQNLIVGSNRLAVDAAVLEARRLGYRTIVLTTRIDGEAREIARVHAAIAREIRVSGRPLRPPACVISGGEPTVTIRGKGLGGRNQEFTLSAAIAIAGLKNVVLLSAGTDGSDGPTDAAGALADGETVARARRDNMDPLRMLAENDSYHFFERLGDLITTGPTGTNVADVQILMVR